MRQWAGGALLLAAVPLGLLEVAVAPLAWRHVDHGVRQLSRALPPAMLPGLHLTGVRDLAVGAAGYTALLGLATLALLPAAVLVWRQWRPARLLARIVATVLAAGQVGAIAVVAVARHGAVAAAAGRRGLPGLRPEQALRILFPGWYLPAVAAVAAVILVLLAVATLLLARAPRPTGAAAGPARRHGLVEPR
ncbi:hypothetical protein Athai_61370 [Actinocatenispora thailandica]|uniref:Uncharacterized protein n=1 Tax=Actinocatenispora thailandica TaxID=227318 RepID=A0A7R7DVI5_9ACTN|nr:hypothetical protein [Actinocatenispora thailandica]BCJ38634.1 hypothetical protein Athai_61370 [Actinocatenispora thailandica]